MRVSIHADAMTTDALRELLAACATAGVDLPAAGLDGPTKWRATTAAMTPNQFAKVVVQLVKLDGVLICDLLDPTVIPEAAQVALGELGEALMKDGEAKDACIERAIALLRGEVKP